ncbi:MAG TPA: glycosyltransferase family 2 protein [Blastocatellia bacterium]|nr:glycosyltransferase family 2 protein [Blastocatellia bacterium]
MEKNSKAGMSPKVSVIIPAYNVAPYITEALDSVAAQGFTDYEVIVINDGSTDELERVLEPYRAMITYVRQENRGLSGARNAGLRLARGQYVALLDADDIWMPDYLEKMVALVEAESADVVYPNAVLFGMPQWEGKLFQDVYPSSAPVTLEKLLLQQCVIFISALFRRDLVNEIGLFDETLRRGEDFDLWVRMALRRGRFAFTTAPLVKYRKRVGSLSGDVEQMVRSTIYVCEKLLMDPRTSEQERRAAENLLGASEARLNHAIAKRMIVDRDFSGAVRHLAMANTHFRSVKLTLVGAALRVVPSLIARLVAR